MLSISQVLPGPNIVNLSLMLGDRFFGLRGAFAALGGMLAVPMVIVLALTAAYAEFSRIAVVSGALRGMGAVAAGLIVATAIKLGVTLSANRLGVPLAAALVAVTFVAVGVLRWPLAWVTPSLGVIAVAIAWQRWR
jgi:chromate transporter